MIDPSNRLQPVDQIGNRGDWAMCVEVIIVENGEKREFWSKDGILLGRVQPPGMMREAEDIRSRQDPLPRPPMTDFEQLATRRSVTKD